ncbi:MAG: transcription termination factor NusA, partial [Acidobacteria bacterium]|nr:transcription termination factor NusA [Acidobacteriota bacterium]
NCTVKRIEALDLICDLGKTEARLPKKEQSRLENFTVGDRARCVIRSVEKAGKNAGVIVSRAAPELVMRLFEQEVPEIYDGTVVIKGCAREAGERTKIAVMSRDRDVDPVGACVGMKGMRVQSIIRELRGEKIDIIEFSEDAVVFATHALSPAKISRVSILNGSDKHMEVIVDDTQLSLAIGKKGQNVRLAAKLLGWKIDIKSEEEKRQEVESQMAALVVSGAPVSVLIDHGLPEEVVDRLVQGGIGTVEKLGSMTPEELEAIPGIETDMVQRLQEAILLYYGQYEGAAEPPAEGAAVPAGEETVPIESVDADFAAGAGDVAQADAEPAEEPDATGTEMFEPAVFEPGESQPEAATQATEPLSRLQPRQGAAGGEPDAVAGEPSGEEVTSSVVESTSERSEPAADEEQAQ